MAFEISCSTRRLATRAHMSEWRRSGVLAATNGTRTIRDAIGTRRGERKVGADVIVCDRQRAITKQQASKHEALDPLAAQALKNNPKTFVLGKKKRSLY